MSEQIPTIPIAQYQAPFRERVHPKAAPRFRYDSCDETCTTDCGHCKGQGRPDTGTHRSFSQAGLASVLPYPIEEVSNSLVELDLAEEAEHAATLARTADRLAAAYAAHVVILGRKAERYVDWVAGERAAREELAAALTEYEEARA